MVDSLREQGRLFRERRLDAVYPYLWLDARYEHVREAGHVRSMAVVIAYGVRADGVREVLGLDVGLSEHVALWRAFLQSLVGRGVSSVQLVISDAQAGPKQAIRAVFLGASWQRCRVHFLRNVLAIVPKSAQAMVAATVRSIFEQESEQVARRQLRQVCITLSARCPRVVSLIEEADEEILPFDSFRQAHWRQIYRTNPLARLNKELKRRSAGVGIFPNRAAVLRLGSALLAAQTDEWLVGRYYFSELAMRALLKSDGEPSPALAETAVA